MIFFSGRLGSRTAIRQDEKGTEPSLRFYHRALTFGALQAVVESEASSFCPVPSTNTLTQARLKVLLHYDPETGHFTWRVTRNQTAIGSRAGSPSGDGYIRIKVDGQLQRAHRLAFLYMTGEFPPNQVDHINRDRTDNRWENLRPATRRENEGNKGLRRDNTSGHRGVSWFKPAKKWAAYGYRNGRRVHLGYFASLEEAAAAAREWREENFGVFAVWDSHR